jgi:hypothetical protein
MDNHGSNFTYTWDVDGDIVWIWFGDKAADNFFRGTFDETGDTYASGQDALNSVLCDCEQGHGLRPSSC